MEYLSKVSILILISLFCLSSCNNFRDREYKKDMGDLKELKRETPGIKKIFISGIPTVQVSKGLPGHLAITGFEKELAKVNIDIRSDSLIVKYTGPNDNSKPSLSMNLYIQELEALDVKSVGKLSVGDYVLNADGSEVSLTSIGSVNIDFSVKNIDCTISSVASAELNGSSESGRFVLSAIALLNLSNFQRKHASVETTAIGRQL